MPLHCSEVVAWRQGMGCASRAKQETLSRISGVNVLAFTYIFPLRGPCKWVPGMAIQR
jgi:hypothetical protein